MEELEIVRGFTMRTRGEQSPLPPRVTMTSMGFSAQLLPRLRKISMGDSEFNSIERVEYVEIGLRVSKRCYTYRTRPVVIEQRVPRSHEEKLGVVALVRLGEPPPGRHAFQPLMGAWHVYGVIPGALQEHRFLMTLFDREHHDRALLAMYQQQGVRECVHVP